MLESQSFSHVSICNNFDVRTGVRKNYSVVVVSILKYPLPSIKMGK
jgi:hypothetical protein